MKRKRFIKLAMAQGMSKREAEQTALYSRHFYPSYQVAFDIHCGQIVLIDFSILDFIHLQKNIEHLTGVLDFSA